MSESNDPIRRALRELPRIEASEGFTASVLDRAASSAPRRRPWQPSPGRLAAAAAALALVVGGGVWEWRQDRAAAARELRAAELLQEQRVLERELESLRRLRSEEPVLYLGGDQDYEFVVGLSPWLDNGSGSFRNASNPVQERR